MKQKPPKLKDYYPLKTANDFRESAIKNNIKYWAIRDCSVCCYELGYLLFYYEECEVVFDAGCDCTRNHVKRESDWEQVAAHYNCNIKNEHVIKEFNEYWKF